MKHDYEHKMDAIRSIAYTLNPIPLRELAQELERLANVKEQRQQLLEALETAQQAHEHPPSIVISTQPTDADLLSILLDEQS